jgi:hypothetical protein
MITSTRSILSTAALLIALAACSVPAASDQAAQNASTPGWTGRTFVVGSNSTIAGDAVATYNQQKWPIGRQR